MKKNPDFPRRSIILCVFLGLSAASYSTPPDWWSQGNPPVVDSDAAQNNHGPANIGQAKWMAKSALEALRAIDPLTADQIESNLLGSGKPIPDWNPPADQAARDRNHAPLLIGQLKAVAAPFYDSLHASYPDWLETQLNANQTKDPANPSNYYPWTTTATDDNNKGGANVGQLKAVFSLNFGALATIDTDGDGLTDAEERALGLNPNDAYADSDSDGMADNWEVLNGLNAFDASDAQLDPDQDGLSNVQEFNQGKNPKVHDVITIVESDWESVETTVKQTTQIDGSVEWTGQWSDGSQATQKMAHEEFLHVLEQRDQKSYDGIWMADGESTAGSLENGIIWLHPDRRQPTNSSSDTSYTIPDGPTTRTTRHGAGKYHVRLARNIATGPQVTEHYIVLIYPLPGMTVAPATSPLELTIAENQQYSETVEVKSDLPYALIGLVKVEVVELSPKTKDDMDVEIVGSEKPSTGKPLTPFVEINPATDKIAHRELKVKIGEALKGKKVTWTLEPVPGATPATIRGEWTNSTSHPNRFEASVAYGANGFTQISQASGKTTVANDGFTAIRVNVPPIGFNQVRIKIQIEGVDTQIDLFDMEVPSVVVIDPGHGGSSNMPGSSSNNAESPSGVLEKTMTLDYGLALRDSLRARRQNDKLNLRVFMTREKDDNLSGEKRANKARDNGADVLFVLHFNSDDDSGTKTHPRVPHRSRGTLEVYRTDSNVSPQEDTALSSDLIDRMVGAMTPFDAGANHRGRVAYGGSGVGGPAVSSDAYNGNTATCHPIRTAYIEGEFIDFGANTTADHTDDSVDILLNTGSNAVTVKTAITDAIQDGIIQNLRSQQ